MLRFCFLGDQQFVFYQNSIKDYCYQAFKWSKHNFPWQGVLVPLVSVLGLCGNLLSILVLTSSKIDMKVIGISFIQRLIWMKVGTDIFSSMSSRFHVSVKYERFEEGNFELFGELTITKKFWNIAQKYVWNVYVFLWWWKRWWWDGELLVFQYRQYCTSRQQLQNSRLMVWRWR